MLVVLTLANAVLTETLADVYRHRALFIYLFYFYRAGVLGTER